MKKYPERRRLARISEALFAFKSDIPGIASFLEEKAVLI